MDVVKKAIEMKKSAMIPFDRVWAVFDKDDFSARKFNGAIIMAKENDINVAWSNQAFELWYLYHFHNRDTAMNRDEYKKAISDAVNEKMSKKGKSKYVYAKNALDNHNIMTEYGDQTQAMKWAEAKHRQWTDEKFATHNPCTTVYKLVHQLMGKDDDLIKEVMDKIHPNDKKGKMM